MNNREVPAARATRLATAALTGLLIVAAVAGCGSSKKGSGPSSTPGAPGASGTTPASATTAASSPGASAPSKADVTAITKAFTTFFSSATPVDDSVAFLQDGAAFRDVLEDQAKTASAGKASATVSKVTLDSPDKASVVFTIRLAGAPVLPNTPGFAVREAGSWKVAGLTFCGLLQVQGSPPPVCAQPAATSLPS